MRLDLRPPSRRGRESASSTRPAWISSSLPIAARALLELAARRSADRPREVGDGRERRGTAATRARPAAASARRPPPSRAARGPSAPESRRARSRRRSCRRRTSSPRPLRQRDLRCLASSSDLQVRVFEVVESVHRVEEARRRGGLRATWRLAASAEAMFESIDSCQSPSRVKMCEGMCRACGEEGAILA